MLHILYLLFIAPLEFLMRLALEWGYSLTHSWGVALVFLSLLVNTLVLPIYNRAEGWQEEERELKRRMARNEAMFRRRCKGWERFVMLSTLRRLHGYDWRLTLRASVGLLLQIPFFFAAFHLLSRYTALNGQSLGLLADLGAPDALLSFGGFSVNVLPIAMTAVNLFSAFFYTRNLTRRDKAQIYGMAGIFLVLLYNAASALTLYWTLNNVYSLGKNIVEKDWLCRPAGRRLQEHWNAVVRNMARRWAEAGDGLTVAGTGFGVGALFWLYTSTVAFAQRDGVLDAGFKSAVSAFAGQCFLTAFAASFVLVFLGLFHTRRRPTPTLLLSIAVLALFLFQTTLFMQGLKVERGRFLFNMWNGMGFLSFAYWGLGIFYFAKYQDRLAIMFGQSGRALLEFLNLAPGGRDRLPSEERPPIPSNRDSLILACLMGCICSGFFCCFIPFSTYFYNNNEFDFSSGELLLYIGPYLIAMSIFCSLIFYVTSFYINYECVRLPFVHNKGYGARSNTVYSFSLIILITIWCEGTILSFNLPLLTGDKNLFNSAGRMVLDTFILLSILLVLIKLNIFIKRNIISVTVFFLLISCASFIDPLISGKSNVFQKYAEGVHGLSLVNRETLFTEFRFSKQKNIILLIVDSLDSLSFEKTLDTYPNLKKVFNGFWFFKENLGVGGARTDFALPQILAGKVYDGPPKLFISSFRKDTLIGLDSMLADARRDGFTVFMDADYWCVIGKDNFTWKIYNRKNDFMTIRNFFRLIFKYFPYIGKYLLQDLVNVQTINSDNIGQKYSNQFSIQGNDVNKDKFNMLINTDNEFDYHPVFSFIHFMGVHIPFIKEDMIASTREYIHDLEKFFYFLKQRDIYDDSIIIVMADHGPGYRQDYRKFYPERKGTFPTVYFPLLLVKMPGSEDEMVIREDLMSSAYVRDMLKASYSKGASNQTMLEFLKTLPKTRKIYNGYIAYEPDLYYPLIGTFDAIGTFNSLKIGEIDYMEELGDIDYNY